jgi:hypothetical protein
VAKDDGQSVILEPPYIDTVLSNRRFVRGRKRDNATLGVEYRREHGDDRLNTASVSEVRVAKMVSDALSQ